MNVLAAKPFNRLKNRILFAVFFSFLASCTVIRDYPAKPFVYETRIDLKGDLSAGQRKDLNNRLNEQLDDSIQVRSVQKLIGLDQGPKAFYAVIKKPPVYDSANAEKSIGFMKALLHAEGFYRDSVYYTAKIDTVGDQLRTKIKFTVETRQLFKIDSLRYNLADSTVKQAFPAFTTSLDTLQALTTGVQSESLLKKGTPFSKTLIAAEFDRLTDVYRNNGYLRFSREEMLAVWDTVGIALLRPSFDPVEQAELFEALQRRRENPVADVEVRLRANKDSSHLVRYYVGDVTVYPDLSGDTSLPVTVRRYKGFDIVSDRNLYKPKVVAENIYFHRGDLYDQRQHSKTLNRFNSIGSWRYASVDAKPRVGTDTVDFTIRLTPALKYLFDVNIEGSHNLGGLYTGSNLIGLNFTLQNRNFARAANQSTTTVGFATEINTTATPLQTIQISAGQTIYFPRLIPKRLPVPRAWKENARTSLAANARYVHRVNYLDLLSVNLSWGYEFNWRKNLLLVRYPNIEYTFLTRGPELETLIESNKSYKYIFNAGLVIADLPVLGYTRSGGRKGVVNIFRANFETSGILAGLLRTPFIEKNLNRYVKLDASFQQTRKIGLNNAFAWRALVGVGNSIPYRSVNGEVDSFRRYMPFYKAYYAGGANSMRGWALRKLGPGSAIKSFDRTVAPERFGDIQIEANAEYRFRIADIRGVVLNSALFTDIGNVWYLRKNPDFEGGEFRFDKFYKDLAVAVGTGLRVDFGFIKIRLDYAFKAKDPSPAEAEAQNKWFYKFNVTKGAFQVGVDYPF